MHSFSDALISLAVPHLAWAAERLDRHNIALAGESFHSDLANGIARVGDRRITAGVLGTYAEDRTFQWSWAVAGRSGAAAAVDSERLRRLGERYEVVELVEPLIDLGGFADPRAAADDLAIMALGLLGVTGVIRYGHGGRALTFIVTEDPAVMPDAPDPATAAGYIRHAAALLDGHGRSRHGAAMVRGYSEHHGLTTRDAAGEVEIDLPGGHCLRARIGEEGELDDVTVTGSDDERSRPGARDAAADEPDPAGYVHVAELDVTHSLPARLLEHAAPAVACCFGGELGLVDQLREHGWDWRTPPGWDVSTGMLRFGDVLELRAQNVGLLRPGGIWEWADTGWAGVEEARASAHRHGAGHLAADLVDLSDHPRQQHVVEVLVRSAAHLGGAGAVWRLPAGDGECHFAIVDPESPDPSVDALLAALETSADVIQQLVLRKDRYPVMRAMVLGLFQRADMVPLFVGEPQMLMGDRGLYQARVYFSVDGTVNAVAFRLQGDFF